MTDDGSAGWKILFRRALEIIDAAAKSGERLDDWTFGGGTVLMRRFHHRVSRDVDIFVPDPQYLGYLSPRLNNAADELTSRYLETAISVKLFFAEGEIDFIASAPLTAGPDVAETVEGRKVRVETTAEILAKKVWHRGSGFTARDIFDFAMAVKRDPAAVASLQPILRKRRAAVRERIASARPALRTAFAGLARLDTELDFDDCTRIVLESLDQA